MKKYIVILLAVASFLPKYGFAGEWLRPSETICTSLEMAPIEMEAIFDSKMAIDEELVGIVGHGLDSFSPWLVGLPQKSENVTSRIKLWDEARQWGSRVFQPRFSDTLQKSTISVFAKQLDVIRTSGNEPMR